MSTRMSLIDLRISSGMSRRSFSFFRGQDDDLGARQVGREDLALEPADREDPTAQGDLAGHRHVLADGDAGQGADDGGRHRDPGRRTVLGDGAGRHVDVQRVVLEDLARDAELGGVGTGPRQAGSRRLAHDLAELAGQDEVLAALHPGDLDGDDVAADLGHDQARRGAGLVLGLQLAVLEALRSEQVGQLLRVDDGLALAALGDLPGDLAHDVGELALEVPDAGLVRVRADQLGHRLVGDLDVLVLEAVVLHLLRDEEPLADLDLLLLGVAGQVDDLHPVAQGRRDRVEQVGGRHEEDLAQVERHLEVVVLEGVVLLRVEDLEQGGARVAPEVHPDLVDLVEHEHRVVRTRPS